MAWEKGKEGESSKSSSEWIDRKRDEKELSKQGKHAAGPGNFTLASCQFRTDPNGHL